MPKENNKMQVDIDNLFKQNVNDLSAIKELYRKLKEVEEKITQIKYIDSNLANKLKKEYENLKKIILDENIQAKLSNDIKTINSQLDTIARKTKGYININSYYCLNPNCNGECGCIKGNGVHDDTSGIKKAISDIKNVYNTLKWNGNYNTLAFPNGEYRITSQIKVPYFIHFKSLGNVVFLCEVPNDSAIWFTPEEDVAIDYNKDWFRSKTIFARSIRRRPTNRCKSCRKSNRCHSIFLGSTSNATTRPRCQSSFTYCSSL